MTAPGAEIFDGQHPKLSRREADRVWDRLTARYAAEASGQVTLTVHDVLVPSVLLQRDLPALRRNLKVTSVRLVDPTPGEERILRRGEF